ncbi:hypothetical protein [Piscibacillus salipiscarius]|uniref:Uncharacterized protein n=1 Tax=Piscibacillus salipiscarius TaxID=299480 RepID=A0ABW5Q929_9BACI|nr:hypothetical protein [Piscibacillus salipiscarius]
MTEDKNKAEKIGDDLEQIGKGCQQIGCALTILITIPVIIILFLL